MSGKTTYLLADSSVLINFLAIDRVALLTDHPLFQFAITDHVRGEITDHYPNQVFRLQIALAAGGLLEWRVDTPQELEAFAKLSLEKRFGAGESAAMAAAIFRECGIAIDDRAAIKHLGKHYPNVHVETTQSLLVGLIREGRLEVAEADRMKEVWEREYKFRLPFRSFQDLT